MSEDLTSLNRKNSRIGINSPPPLGSRPERPQDPMPIKRPAAEETQRALSILLSIAEDDNLHVDVRIDACRAILGK